MKLQRDSLGEVCFLKAPLLPKAFSPSPARIADLAWQHRHPRRKNRVVRSIKLVQAVAGTTADGFTWPQDAAFEPDRSSPISAEAIAAEYFNCFNQRDTEGMLSLLAESCTYRSLAYSETFSGKQAMARLLDRAMANLPPGMRLIIEESCGGAAPSAGLIWHAELESQPLPGSKGLSFLRLDGSGLIMSLYDAPEFPMKLDVRALPLLNAAATLLSSLGGSLRQRTIHSRPPASGYPPRPDQAPPLVPLNAPSQGRTASLSNAVQLPASVPRLRAELRYVRAERDALETRLKRLLRAQRASLIASSCPGDPATSPARPRPTRGMRAWQQPEQAATTPYALREQLQDTRSAGAAAALSGRSSMAASSGVVQSRGPGTGRAAGFRRSASGSAAAEPTSPSSAPGKLAGTWVKDTGESDSAAYERALDLMGLGGLQKQTALRLIEGLEIELRGADISVRFLTVVPFFKVTEEFSTARETRMSRRDLRAGQQRARASFGADSMHLDISWDSPFAGTVEDDYILKAPNLLHVVSKVTIGGRTETTLQVYRRRDSWQPRYSFPGFFGR